MEFFFNKTFGKYPYPVYSVIQAGDGGMEYPMATLITGERSFPSLLSVTIHEILHSWYQMILGTNESYFAWMDEGFASFAQNRTQFMLFNNVYKLDSVNSLKNFYQRYFKFLEKDIEEPLTTHSDHFSTNEAYGVASYTKGAIFLSQLGYIIGDENLFSGLRTYFNKWKFKHPDKYDFIRIMEKQSEKLVDIVEKENQHLKEGLGTIQQNLNESVGFSQDTIKIFQEILQSTNNLVQGADQLVGNNHSLIEVMNKTSENANRMIESMEKVTSFFVSFKISSSKNTNSGIESEGSKLDVWTNSPFF